MAEKKNKVELQNFLDIVIEKVTSNIDVDEIVLFGSYAKGNANEWSDVDIAVISPEFDSNNLIFENVRKLRRQADLYIPYLQLFAFPSKNFYSNNFVDPGFIKEIKNTGKSIYSKERNLIK